MISRVGFINNFDLETAGLGEDYLPKVCLEDFLFFVFVTGDNTSNRLTGLAFPANASLLELIL